MLLLSLKRLRGDGAVRVVPISPSRFWVVFCTAAGCDAGCEEAGGSTTALRRKRRGVLGIFPIAASRTISFQAPPLKVMMQYIICRNKPSAKVYGTDAKTRTRLLNYSRQAQQTSFICSVTFDRPEVTVWTTVRRRVNGDFCHE